MTTATAVTPTLFLGDELDLPHVYVYGDASEQIRRGATVLTDSEETCLITLLNLGIPYMQAKDKITRAKFGLPNEDIELDLDNDSTLIELLTDYE